MLENNALWDKVGLKFSNESVEPKVLTNEVMKCLDVSGHNKAIRKQYLLQVQLVVSTS
jgi:hypothetical protein